MLVPGFLQAETCLSGDSQGIEVLLIVLILVCLGPAQILFWMD